jgi:hypothetical protein
VHEDFFELLGLESGTLAIARVPVCAKGAVVCAYIGLQNFIEIDAAAIRTPARAYAWDCGIAKLLAGCGTGIILGCLS